VVRSPGLKLRPAAATVSVSRSLQRLTRLPCEIQRTRTVLFSSIRRSSSALSWRGHETESLTTSCADCPLRSVKQSAIPVPGQEIKTALAWNIPKGVPVKNLPVPKSGWLLDQVLAQSCPLPELPPVRRRGESAPSLVAGSCRRCRQRHRTGVTPTLLLPAAARRSRLVIPSSQDPVDVSSPAVPADQPGIWPACGPGAWSLATGSLQGGVRQGVLCPAAGLRQRL
jgi:hypothetical protein